MAKELKELTKRADNYSQWFNDLVVKADLAEQSAVRGCMVIKPYGYAIWEKMQQQLDKMFKETGAQNAYFPLLIPKSFSLKEEEKASKFFLSSFEAHGGIVGLAVMFFVGVRENEACGLCFKDIKEMKHHPGTYYLDVGYETTKINSNDLKGGGKTRNAPRRLVLLPEQYEFLKKRMEYVEHQTGSSCLDLPIVCRGDRFDVRCSTIDLSVEGRRFFKDVMKMRESEIAATSTEMVLNENGEFYEEDPTTYFLRRNAATRLYVHDLSIEECQYFMGHDIESARFLRSDFSDEDMLYSIYQKLMKDPFSDNCTL